jgi:hypothetical protein
VAEKVVQDLHKSLAATSFDQVGRAEAAADIVSRTADLMRLGASGVSDNECPHRW